MLKYLVKVNPISKYYRSYRRTTDREDIWPILEYMSKIKNTRLEDEKKRYILESKHWQFFDEWKLEPEANLVKDLDFPVVVNLYSWDRILSAMIFAFLLIWVYK